MKPMYWPDYSLRPKRRRAWRAPAFLLTLAAAILAAGFLNGWWQLPQPNGDPEPEANGVVIVETVAVFPLDPSQPAYEPPPTPVPVKNAADFALPDLFDETIIRRRSDYNGRPLVFNFWASWCVPCREEMLALQQAYEANRDDGLVVLGINETYIDDLDAARSFVNELGLTFPNVRDDSSEMSDQLYRVIGLPTSVFITPQGDVAHVQIGQMSQTQIETFSRQLIAGEPIMP
jgi:thiol-disulfide isomerase/thioredoxin